LWTANITNPYRQAVGKMQQYTNVGTNAGKMANKTAGICWVWLGF